MIKFNFSKKYLAVQGAALLLLCHSAIAQKNGSLNVVIDVNIKAQKIDNIGASAAWFSENIGKFWAVEKREQMAKWLFSKAFDKDGNPVGIGLSSFRFNIGGGSAEQGDSSGIRDFRRRAECFLSPDGTYDWSKQSGYLWFVKKANEYGVENLIAFSNTPPVQFTQNGLGYKTVKDFRSNLKADKYGDYAAFLTAVLQHFDKEGLHFKYISPVNEPQWAWYDKYMEGSQEGTPWRNEEIAKVVRALDSTLTAAHSASKILMTEAGHLGYLYGKTDGPANHQIQALYADGSPLQVNKLSHVLNVAGGHSYFTDNGDTGRIEVRSKLADTAKKYGAQYWETEYSMLGDGYKEGKKGKIPAMDCALFLAKVMHDDLVYGNAGAWQLWNSWEPSSADSNVRYCLIALKEGNKAFTDGDITSTKNLWAMGHYSRFIRPGMSRLAITRNDGLSKEAIAQQLMVSAYASSKQLVLVAINYTENQQTLTPAITGFGKPGKYKKYTTTADKDVNMKFSLGVNLAAGIQLPPRSIVTIVVDRN